MLRVNVADLWNVILYDILFFIGQNHSYVRSIALIEWPEGSHRFLPKPHTTGGIDAHLIPIEALTDHLQKVMMGCHMVLFGQPQERLESS